MEKVAQALLLSTLIATPAFRAGAAEIRPLRLCADPTNLPFSSDDPARPGLYLEIGQLIARKLERPVTYSWYKSYFGKRTVRETLLKRQCDAMVGLPEVDDFMGPAVIFSKPIAREGYALVSAKGRNIGDVDDLKGMRVAVQYQSTPQNLLAQRDEIEKVTVLSPDEGMKLLDQGKVDVAFIWAPVAGWLNKAAYGEKYQIRTTAGEGLVWPTAIGFAKASTGLRDDVNLVLPSLQEDIDKLFAKYGVPSDVPVKFGELGGPTAIADAGPSEPVTVGQSAGDSKPSEIKATASGDISAGRELFNGTCGHCHGPDAVQAEKRINLRLMKKRYGSDMEATYWKTVHDGRPSKGMPAWKEVYGDDELRNVLVYLQTVQDAADGSN
ncbi:cytochrome C [Bradyrhizobium lablabi]|uniref:Cytochrome C n=1 Tax=Bradyrhizobium lablabi TaxID=722472 RepID=A0A0R3MV08_9BRAD|nr:transporter substrate-binding domain-containing protein [Bradyrhizobium lablabi]KRR21472.1 cytochrome C [Bradyrhizobium lablabi]